MKKNRSTLKDYFKKGTIPTEANFSDLIDSMLNQEEDTINTAAGEPLRITSGGTDEGLLNFYRTEKGQPTPGWQVQQKPGGKLGLSISEAAGSRLFIESGTGRVGIGTTTPGSTLDVNGSTNLNGTLSVKGPLSIGSIQLTGFTAADADEWPNFVWYRDVNASWDEGLIKHGPTRGKFARSGFGIHFHQSREFGFFSTGWDALFAVAGQSGDTFIKGRLEVGGDLTVRGNAITTGSVYAGGNPVVYENFEIALRGSAFESPDGNNTYLKIANISMGMDTSRGINTVILNPNGTFKAKATYDLWANANLWNDWATWVNNTAANGDIVAAASFDALSNAVLGGTAESLLRGIGALEAFSAVKGGGQRSPYALLFIKGGRAVEVSVPYRGPNAQLKTTYYDLLNNTVRGDSFVRRSLISQRMYPDNPIVYQDIFDAKKAGAIARLGGAPYDETTNTSKNPWYERPIIKYGSNNDPDGNGALVIIPPGYDTVWVRVLGDRWNAIKAYFTDGAQENLGLWLGGFRATNCYGPDGSLSDGTYFSADSQNRTAHQWLPIPAGRAGQLALVSKPNTSADFWLSGVAFSRNPWGHAGQQAVGYYWASNSGDAVKWNTHVWNDDVLAELTAKSNYELTVPVVPNGRDKLLYLVEHNNNWNGAMHNGITVNGNPIERFLASYDNPFARHWNSKFYERYFAARIPASMISANSRWLKVKVDMSKQTNSIFFREIGTHDLDAPLG